MDRRLKILIMLALPPLVEPLTSNMPWSGFLNPWMYLLLFIAYSLPALLIREIAARKQLGVAGLFLLGLAYGILNEGVMAKTLQRTVGVPMPGYDGYGLIFGFNLPWAAVILVFHSLLSIVFPIMLFHFMFPDERGKSWLGDIRFAALMAFSFLLYSFFFLFAFGGPLEKGSAIPLFHYPVLFIAMLVLGLLALKAPKWAPEGGKSGIRPAIFGFLIMLVFAFFFGLAEQKPQFLLYCALFIIAGAICAYLMKRFGWTNYKAISLTALGAYFGFGLFAFFAVSARGVFEIACWALLQLALLIAIFLVHRK
jgi:hypothetical protein